MDPTLSSFFPIDHTAKGHINKTTLWTIGKILLVMVLIIGAYTIGIKTASNNTTIVNKTTVPKPSFSKTLNQTFSFPVKDDKGNVVTTVKYTILSVELQDQIILQGQKADAVAGRTFFIINLKIDNPSTQSMQLNTKDFIRVRIDNSPELLAPEIHNDPVTIQPISTKFTRLGLPVSDTLKDIKLVVGELNGQKITIDVPVKK